MMDKYTIRKLKEHTRPGCWMIDTNKRNQNQPGKTLHKCACSWMGWLVPESG